MLPFLIPALHFGSEDPLAPVDRAPWHHHALTEAACRAEGWTAPAATESAWATVGVDLYSYHPVWRMQGGPDRWRTARRSKATLDALHFDDLPDTATIEEVWHRILGGTLIGLDLARANEDVAGARHLVGVSLHAVQDFYSHSSWINAPERRQHTWLSTWDRTRTTETAPVEVPGDLVTGGFAQVDGGNPPHGATRITAAALLRLPAMVLTPMTDALRHRLRLSERHYHSRLPRGVRQGQPVGINLDSRWQAPAGSAQRHETGVTPDALFESAYHLALTESRFWLRLLADRAGQDFWAEVLGAPAERWTEAFQRPDGGLYDFMAAGIYPPTQADSGAWFLRVSPLDHQRPLLIELTIKSGTIGPRTLPGRSFTIGPVDAQSQVRVDGPAHVRAFRRAPTAVSRVLAERAEGPVPVNSLD